MKKSTKKLLSCALIALFMGASVGTAVAVSNSAPAVVASAASISQEYSITINVEINGAMEAMTEKFTAENAAEVRAALDSIKADFETEENAGYAFKWVDANGVELGDTLPLADCEYTLEKSAIEYSITINVEINGAMEAMTEKFTVENAAEVRAALDSIKADFETEENAGYAFKWVDASGAEIRDTLPLADCEYTLEKTAIEYTVSFTHPRTGMPLAAPITYTVENMADVEFPAVPEELAMEGYDVAWNKTPADLVIGGTDVNPVWTAIEYTITFAGCEGVEAITFTVETKDAIVLPAVPEKAGYTAAWDKAVEDIALEDTTITAVYTEISVEPENPESSAPESSVPESSEPESSETESSAPETSEPDSTKKGCGSTVGLVGMTAILGVVGAALVVGKKKED